MKVVHVTYEYPGETANCGGGGRVVQTLHNRLCERGHDSQVITQQSPHYAVWPLWSLRNIVETIDEADPDVIHGHFAIPSSLLLPRIADRFDVPLVVTAMGADVYDPTRFGLIRPLLDKVVRRVFEAADSVVAPSAGMVRRIREKYNVMPLLVPHGIDVDDWQWRDRDRPSRGRYDPLRVLTVCRHVERKNLQVACEATAELEDRGVCVGHRLVGTGPRRAALQEQFGGAGVGSFPGYVDDLQPEFDSADIFFLPSKHEAFGLAFCEALACGLPIVTSDRGGQSEIVRDGVGETRPHDAGPKAYADALQTVAEGYQMFQNATEGYVEREYSAEQMTDRYAVLYETFLEEEPTRDVATVAQ
jgi:Glycosyltransferase